MITSIDQERLRLIRERVKRLERGAEQDPHIKDWSGAYYGDVYFLLGVISARASPAAVGGDEIPWSVVQERAGTDVMTIAMDSKAGRLTASGLMEAIASYAESAYRVGYAAASSPLPAEPPQCSGCGNEIDPKTCWCGQSIDHGYDNHMVIPMGCSCYRDDAAPAEPEGEQEFNLLAVLKAAANYIILPEQMEQLSPGAREAIIKGLLWAIRETENAATPPETPVVAREAAAREIAEWAFKLEKPLTSETDLRVAQDIVAAIITRYLGATSEGDKVPSTQEQFQWTMNHLLYELTAYLDTLTITSDNIGDIRRSLFMPWESRWNGIVREQTADRELSPNAAATTPPSETAVGGEAHGHVDFVFDKTPCCKVCGLVRPAEGWTRPCKGPSELSLRRSGVES